MGFSVDLTFGASRDLEEICDHLANLRGADDAARLLDEFLDRIATLESFPHRGAIPPELETLGIHDFRQLHLGRFRMVYRVAGERVFVMLIADGRRDMQSLLQQRLLGR